MAAAIRAAQQRPVAQRARAHHHAGAGFLSSGLGPCRGRAWADCREKRKRVIHSQVGQGNLDFDARVFKTPDFHLQSAEYFTTESREDRNEKQPLWAQTHASHFSPFGFT